MQLAYGADQNDSSTDKYFLRRKSIRFICLLRKKTTAIMTTILQHYQTLKSRYNNSKDDLNNNENRINSINNGDDCSKMY